MTVTGRSSDRARLRHRSAMYRYLAVRATGRSTPSLRARGTVRGALVLVGASPSPPRSRHGRSRAGAGHRGRPAARARRRPATPRSRAWRLRHRRAHDHVAEQRRRIAGIGRRAGAAAALVGLAPAGRHVVVHREREHVGRAVARRGSVRSAPRSSARRRTAATSRPSGPNRSSTRSSLEHELREPHPARHVDDDVALLVGAEHAIRRRYALIAAVLSVS